MALDLQNISDRIEIEELLVRYSRAIDYRNFEELEGIFTEDAEFDAGGLGKPVGPAAIRAMIEGTLTGLDATQHLVAKSLIEIDGDTAEVRTYLFSQHIRKDAPGVDYYMLGAEYCDRARRTPEGWRLTYRRLDRMWTVGDREVIAGRPQ